MIDIDLVGEGDKIEDIRTLALMRRDPEERDSSRSPYVCSMCVFVSNYVLAVVGEIGFPSDSRYAITL